ncbi:hypothetical protein L1987_06635 [Smallanthus sonchifolius]|uniref:Uncharacterized protein n=1 Tax=Smallanthus sonchifolius TaxID=185202 RepID=A0ACB9JYS1_9ASTR|nr:hypothetical protein L1987_06635 [Smallanthus sonchifolius]
MGAIRWSLAVHDTQSRLQLGGGDDVTVVMRGADQWKKGKRWWSTCLRQRLLNGDVREGGMYDGDGRHGCNRPGGRYVASVVSQEMSRQPTMAVVVVAHGG